MESAPGLEFETPARQNRKPEGNMVRAYSSYSRRPGKLGFLRDTISDTKQQDESGLGKNQDDQAIDDYGFKQKFGKVRGITVK